MPIFKLTVYIERG